MKKLMIILNVLCIVTLLVGTLGCDYFSLCYMYVDNQTNDVIRITVSEKPPYYPKIVLEVLPNSKGLLYEDGIPDKKINCADMLRPINEVEVDIQTSSGRTLIKEIWDISNWRCSGSWEEGWEQTFTITEDDLE